MELDKTAIKELLTWLTSETITLAFSSHLSGRAAPAKTRDLIYKLLIFQGNIARVVLLMHGTRISPTETRSLVQMTDV